MALSVTATQAGSGTHNGLALTVKAVTGGAASPIGATATSNSVTTPELAITPAATGSWVYGAVTIGGASATYTAAANTTFTQNHLSTVAYGTFRSTSTVTGGTPVTVGATAPAAASGIILVGLLEIQVAAGAVLAEDASSPATVFTTAAITATTASFTPPGGSLLVAMVSSNLSGTAGQSMTMSITDSYGLTWTEQVVASYVNGASTFAGSSIWTALVPLTVAPPRVVSQAVNRASTY